MIDARRYDMAWGLRFSGQGTKVAPDGLKPFAGDRMPAAPSLPAAPTPVRDHTQPSRFSPRGLRGRVSLLVTGVAAVLLAASGGWWVLEARNAIHEETEAATRVAAQWITVLAAEAERDRAIAGDTEGAQVSDALAMRLAAVGRLRANTLEISDEHGAVVYRSPPPTYKAGREPPAWFADLIAPRIEPRHIQAAGLRMTLLPDTSRSVLDAWDELAQIAGWALSALILLGLAIGRLLDRMLAPLAELNAALARTADGAFDTRLPRRGVAEIDRLAVTYNRMAEQLESTLMRNARLERDQAFTNAVNTRLEEERRVLARELHDELGQGLTAVRAIAGAIAQRSGEQAGLHGNAQAILAMTSQMQDGVHAILQRLRRADAPEPALLSPALAGYCAHWARLYPQIRMQQHIETIARPLAEDYCLAVMRLLQESLTNVARHAQASRVDVSLGADDAGLALHIADDGVGIGPGADPAVSRFGLRGMRERAAEFGGSVGFETPAGGGLCVLVRLPWPAPAAHEDPTPCTPPC